MSCKQQRANMNIITKYGIIILSTLTTLTTLTVNPSTAQTEELLLAETNAFSLSQPVETRTVVTLLEEMIEVKANVEEQNALKPMPKVKKEVEEVLVVEEVSEPEEVFWTIQYGDTLKDIAKKHQVSTLDIQYNNEHITDINNIVVGETYLVGGTVFQEAPENWTAPIVGPEVVEEPIIEDVYYPEAVEEVVETYVAPVETYVAPAPEPAPVANSYQVTVEATGYSTMQPVLSDYTSTGVNLHQNPWVIAIDPVYYNYGTTVEIPGYGTFTMNDSGGDIKGPNRIDIHFPTVEQALAFGRRTITMTVYN